MARNAKRATSRRKSPNGEGDIVTLYFNESDHQEARALEMAKLLAQRHGRRKATLVAALDALYAVYETTGEIPSTTEIANALAALSEPGRQSGIGFIKAVGQPLKEVPSSSRRDPVGVQIVEGSKVSAAQSARNFVSSAASMGFFE